MIYERTQQGQYAAYDASSPLPRKLRSLLKVLDGKTATEVYIKSLESFGDVPKLLQSLQMAGLLAPVDEGAAGAPSEKSRPTTSFLDRLRESRQSVSNRSAYTGATEILTVSAERLSAHAGRDTRALPSEARATDSAERSSALARCLDEMASFVLAYVPAQAFAVLKELEEVGDLEQLAIILGGYEQIISDAGEPAQTHIAHIKQMMREHW